MAEYIILTTEQKDNLLVRKVNYEEIFSERKVDFNPVLLANGTEWVLPLETIINGEFLELYTELWDEGLIQSDLVIRELTVADFPPPLEL